MTAPTTAGGAALPVVAWKIDDGGSSFISQTAWENNAFYLSRYTIPLTPRDPAQAELDALRAELERKSEAIQRLWRERDALKAAQDDQARDAGRLALLETALSEVLEFQSAPEGPHIFDWGRWRRIRDNTPPFQRAATKETP